MCGSVAWDLITRCVCALAPPSRSTLLSLRVILYPPPPWQDPRRPVHEDESDTANTKEVKKAKGSRKRREVRTRHGVTRYSCHWTVLRY